MKYEPEHCPVCKRLFLCKVGNITQCPCAKVTLSHDVARFLEDEFDSCLCICCLKLINSYGFLATQNRDKLMEKLKESMSLTMYDIVVPSQTDTQGILLGGQAILLMDKAAFILASRYARKNVVSASSDKINFEHPIKVGQLLEIEAEISDIGSTSLNITVDLFGEDLRTGDRIRCTSGNFSMVALDKFGKPTQVKNLF